MAGLLANSSTQTMTSGDESADNAVSGYLNQEQIVLTVTPAGSAYSWAIGKPPGSTAKSNLSSSTGASVTFTPDEAGYYTITCLVDSTTSYTLRISVTDTAESTAKEALRYQPKADAEIGAPAAGTAVYHSTERGLLTRKIASAAEAFIAHPGDIGADLGDTDETITLAQGTFRFLPASTLTTTRTKTLSTSGAAVGHCVAIQKMDDAQTLDVTNGGGGGGTWSFTGKHYLVFRFDGTNWAPHERYDLS